MDVIIKLQLFPSATYYFQLSNIGSVKGGVRVNQSNSERNSMLILLTAVGLSLGIDFFILMMNFKYYLSISILSSATTVSVPSKNSRLIIKNTII